MPRFPRRAAIALILGATGSGLSAQTPTPASPSASTQGPRLTLEEALRLARTRNGNIIAAQQNVRASQQRVRQSLAPFYPTVTPSYVYNSSSRQFQGAFGAGFLTQEGGSSFLSTGIRLLDSGERDFTLRASKRSRDAQVFGARQTLRTVLFTVTQQYYDTLRAQELQRVADSQVARTQEILRATDARIEVGAAARIDRLQANANLQNALVEALTARNRVTNNGATLKGTLGLEAGGPLPTLVPEGEVVDVPPLPPLTQLLAEGRTNRPDLLSRRRNVESLRLGQRRADREAGLALSVDFNFNEQLTPQLLQDRALQLNASFPLFDGGRSRARARELALGVDAERSLLVQAERNALAEIEAAYNELLQNSERTQAALTAREAARQNYAAAAESQILGANDLLQVITAQVSLVTAEANYIQAVYDLRISQSRINLVTGRPVPGETEVVPDSVPDPARR